MCPSGPTAVEQVHADVGLTWKAAVEPAAAASHTQSAGQTARCLTKSDLIAYLASGCKPKSRWRIGVEHEKLGIDLASGMGRRPTYQQIEALLASFQDRFGWDPIMERGKLVGLKREVGGAVVSMTLESGGQLEMSGAPLRTLHDTHAEVTHHLRQVKEVSEEHGIGYLSLGFDPKWSLEEMPRMPKSRCANNRAYLSTRGSSGGHLLGSCTVQVNLDYESERDMVQKMRVGLALQPIATALCLNSPFKEGRPSGHLSWRSHAWTDTDPDRCGMLPFVFDPGFGFERYVEYMLDVPMLHVVRGGVSHYAGGLSFRDFMQGELPGLPGVVATLEDWEVHLGTVFPEVRLKRFIEMRGADSGRHVCALPALWVGLLYDEQAQAEALELIEDWSHEEREQLRHLVPSTGLRTPFRQGVVQGLAKKVLAISRGGLERRGQGEERYLQELEAIAESGVTQADRLLQLYNGEWGRSVDPVFSPQFCY